MNATVNRTSAATESTKDISEATIGRFGRMRAQYLKEHRPVVYNELLMSGQLGSHLAEIDEAAQARIEAIMPELAKTAGATEELKASDQMRWVGLMNACREQAEEIVKDELIYS